MRLTNKREWRFRNVWKYMFYFIIYVENKIADPFQEQNFFLNTHNRVIPLNSMKIYLYKNFQYDPRPYFDKECS